MYCRYFVIVLGTKHRTFTTCTYLHLRVERVCVLGHKREISIMPSLPCTCTMVIMLWPMNSMEVSQSDLSRVGVKASQVRPDSDLRTESAINSALCWQNDDGTEMVKDCSMENKTKYWAAPTAWLGGWMMDDALCWACSLMSLRTDEHDLMCSNLLY